MSPKRLALFVLPLAVVALAWFLAPRPHSLPAESYSDGRSKSLEPLFPAPAFAYVDQHGQTVTNRSLQGKVWVANFIFTQCRTICPLLTAKMVQLQRKLEGVDMRFVSFSVDPEHDTPEVLADYARRWRAEETRWTLLSTTEQLLPRTAQGFHIAVMKNDGGEPGNQVIHTSVFMLVDGEGMVRGVYDSEQREDFAALAEHARKLAGSSPPAPKHAALDGEALYHELSCAGCHERAELAPALRGLSGKRRDIGNGLLVVADAAYVKESILNPDAKRVQGYPVHMPTYAGLVDDAQLDTLVTWVLARPAEPSAQDETAKMEVDPVCEMAVRVDPQAISAQYGGQTYYFCSDNCRERFQAHPEAFLTHADAGAVGPGVR